MTLATRKAHAPKVWTVLDRALGRVERVGIAVAALAFAAVMAVTVVDIVSRYALHAPLTWSFDLITNYLLVAGFFLAVSAAQANRQHVNIDLFARMMPPRLRAAVLIPGYSAAIVFVAIIAWAAATAFIGAWNSNLVMDGVIAWPRWPTYLLVTLGAGLLAFRLCVDCIAHFVAASGNSSLDGGTMTGPNGGHE